MSVSYDLFTETFLSKITEYDFINLPDEDRTEIVDGYMKRAVSEFNRICKYDLSSTADDTSRQFNTDIPENEIDEIVDIISEAMIIQWLKPYLYKQELLENALNTRDFSTFSPEALLNRVKDLYKETCKKVKQDMREYSYNYGKLDELHL